MNSPFLFGLGFELAAGAAVHLDGDFRTVDRLALVVGDHALHHAGGLRRGRQRHGQQRRTRASSDEPRSAGR